MTPRAIVTSVDSDPPVEVATVAELEFELDRVATGASHVRPTIVTVIAHSTELLIGLGAVESFVQVAEESGDGAPLITLGDPDALGVAEFWFHGSHHTEVPRRYLVPASSARAIAREFLVSGRRDAAVNWVEVGS